MSEEQHGYGTVKEQLQRLETYRQIISADPAASYWLKQAATQLWERDVVDALHDLDVLRDLLEAKHCTDLLMLERWATHHDGTKH
jgi:hypothetical protein